MSKLTWDQTGQRLYETGVRNGVLYPISDSGIYDKGYSWNGLTSVNENPSGADESEIYADDIKYLGLRAAEKYGATIEAYTYPDEFAECDGSAELIEGVSIGQQARKKFGFCYRTTIGNDVKGEDYGYKLHLIYGATASPSSKDHGTINESPEAVTMSWEISTTPVEVGTINGKKYKPTATIDIDSTKVGEEKMAKIEEILYGRDADESKSVQALDPRLPLPDEIYTILSA